MQYILSFFGQITFSSQESQCLYMQFKEVKHTICIHLISFKGLRSMPNTLHLILESALDLWLAPRLGEIVQKCLFTFSTLKRSSPKLCGSDRGICDPERNSGTCFDISKWLTPFDLWIKRHPISHTFIHQRQIMYLLTIKCWTRTSVQIS